MIQGFRRSGSHIAKLALAAACAFALVAAAMPHGKPWPVPEAAKKMPNPVKAGPEVLKAAKAIYVVKCEQCHGEKGDGDGVEAMMYTTKPADFTDGKMMAEMTDGEIFWKMSEGREPMPSFKKTLTEEQRWQLVHFVRTFAKPGKPAKQPAHKHD